MSITIAKRHITLLHARGAQGPILTSITLSGASSTVMTHTTTYTAVGLDQRGNVISLTPIFVSGTTSHATIDSSSGVATPVAAGTTSITAHATNSQGTVITSNAITLTVAAQVPTTTTVSPNPWSATAGGSTVTFTAVVTDQVGGTISSPSGAWSSSDATDAPINSSTGVLNPTNAAGGIVVTFTPTGFSGAAGTSTGTITTSGGASPYDPTSTTTGAGILATNGAVPIWADWPSRYANDTAFRAAIFYGLGTFSNPALVGTYNNATYGDTWTPSTRTGPRYGDGRNVDLQQWVSTPDATFGPSFSEACWEASLYNQNAAAPTPTPELYPYLASGTQPTAVVLMRRLANCSTPKFTGVGDGNAMFNAGSGAAWKSGMFASFASGRAGQETGNYVTGGGSPFGNIFLLVGNAGTTGGFTENTYGVNTNATWYSGAPRWESLIIEQWERVSDSTFWCAITRWIKTSDAGSWTQDSPRIVGPIGAIGIFTEFGVNSNDNYNQSRATLLKLWYMQAAVFDFNNPNSDGSNDPAGFLATKAAGTPTTPGSISVTSKSSSAVTCSVQTSIGMGRVRLKIDGTMISGQDYVLKREDGEVAGVTGGGMATAVHVSVPVTGLSLATGSHTVVAYAVNVNNTVLDPTGVSTTFTL